MLSAVDSELQVRTGPRHFGIALLSAFLCSCATPSGPRDGASVYLEDMHAENAAGAIAGTPVVVFGGTGFSGGPGAGRVHIVFINFETEKVVNRKSVPFDMVRGPFVAPNGRVFVAKSSDGRVGIWRTDDITLASTLPSESLPRYGGSRIGPGRNDEELVVGDKIWRLADGAQVGTAQAPDTRYAYRSNDGKLEARLNPVRDSGDRRVDVELWDTQRRQALSNTTLEHTGSTSHALFSPSGSLVAIQSFNFSDKGIGGGNRVSVLNTATGKTVRDVKMSTFCTFRAWHPTQNAFFVGCLQSSNGEIIQVHTVNP